MDIQLLMGETSGQLDVCFNKRWVQIACKQLEFEGILKNEGENIT